MRGLKNRGSLYYEKKMDSLSKRGNIAEAKSGSLGLKASQTKSFCLFTFLPASKTSLLKKELMRSFKQFDSFKGMAKSAFAQIS
jgi:hypothetical protein